MKLLLEVCSWGAPAIRSSTEARGHRSKVIAAKNPAPFPTPMEASAESVSSMDITSYCVEH